MTRYRDRETGNMGVARRWVCNQWIVESIEPGEWSVFIDDEAFRARFEPVEGEDG